jgi:hypothetical protein
MNLTAKQNEAPLGKARIELTQFVVASSHKVIRQETASFRWRQLTVPPFADPGLIENAFRTGRSLAHRQRGSGGI